MAGGYDSCDIRRLRATLRLLGLCLAELRRYYGCVGFYSQRLLLPLFDACVLNGFLDIARVCPPYGLSVLGYYTAGSQPRYSDLLVAALRAGRVQFDGLICPRQRGEEVSACVLMLILLY